MPPENETLLLTLGEIKGQLRELVHSHNNSQAKMDTLFDVVHQLKPLIKDMEDLRGRVMALEIDRYKRTGALVLIERVGASPIFWAAIAGIATLITFYNFIRGE